MDKLAIINSMEVVESSASGGELEYVLVENNEENRKKLMEIGVPYDEIKDATDDGDIDHETIDISSIGFIYTHAKWFQERVGGFLDHVPEDAPEWAK